VPEIERASIIKRGEIAPEIQTLQRQNSQRVEERVRGRSLLELQECLLWVAEPVVLRAITAGRPTNPSAERRRIVGRNVEDMKSSALGIGYTPAL
jgi:hypothetical protein